MDLDRETKPTPGRRVPVMRNCQFGYVVDAEPLLHDVATVLLDTGMRPEECNHLSWENLNWDAGRHGTIMITRGKTKAARRLLPMTPRVRLVLELRCEAAGKPTEGWVWPADTRSKHMEHDTLRVQHKKAPEKSKVRDFVIYSFRHTFLTRLGESGCDAWTLARIARTLQHCHIIAACAPVRGRSFISYVSAEWHNSGHIAKTALPERTEEEL